MSAENLGWASHWLGFSPGSMDNRACSCGQAVVSMSLLTPHRMGIVPVLLSRGHCEYYMSPCSNMLRILGTYESQHSYLLIVTRNMELGM